MTLPLWLQSQVSGGPGHRLGENDPRASPEARGGPRAWVFIMLGVFVGIQKLLLVQPSVQKVSEYVSGYERVPVYVYVYVHVLMGWGWDWPGLRSGSGGPCLV